MREKLEGLKALEGGIVYAQEEAWDRLQARMSEPKKRSVWPLPVRVAAAAVLLLCVAGGVYSLISGEEERATSGVAVLPVPAVPVPTVAAAPDVHTEPVVVVPARHGVAVGQRDAPKQYVTTPDVPDEVVVGVPDEVVVGVPDVAVVQEVPAVVDSGVVMPAVRKMRVVHINNVGEAMGAEVGYVYEGPKLDMRKMKVVSIHDVERYEYMHRQEEEVLRMVRTNRTYGDGLWGVANRAGGGYRAGGPVVLYIRLNSNK